MRILRAPALHFLCLGAALWALQPRADRAGAGLRDEELLYRAAVELDVARNDPAVRDRLAKLGGFVGEDVAEEADREEAARRLGLAESDLVVRRHLTMLMRLAAGGLSRDDLPTDADLDAFAAAHAGELALPARTRFTHVYLGRDRRRAALDADAAALLARLRRDRVAPDDARALGDAFPTGSDVGPLADADVDRRFGPGFAARLAAAEPGAWLGPVPSSYGLHLVWVRERLAETAPSRDAVRGRLVHRWLDERRARRASERIAALRARAD